MSRDMAQELASTASSQLVSLGDFTASIGIASAALHPAVSFATGTYQRETAHLMA